ncbi:MAG TPA: hypothetical protein VJX94_03200 [Stellaceae bacterium]|nr:hypothetical protein [Stellaceae bacterium]
MNIAGIPGVAPKIAPIVVAGFAEVVVAAARIVSISVIPSCGSLLLQDLALRKPYGGNGASDRLGNYLKPTLVKVFPFHGVYLISIK